MDPVLVSFWDLPFAHPWEPVSAGIGLAFFGFLASKNTDEVQLKVESVENEVVAVWLVAMTNVQRG